MSVRHIGNIKVILFVLLPVVGCHQKPAQFSAFSFAVTSDTHCNTQTNGFDLAAKEISQLNPAFLLTSGDMHHQSTCELQLIAGLVTTEKEPGKNYLWYPVTGNHDMDNLTNMQLLRDHNPGGDSLPHIVNHFSHCPETVYSWDYQNAHFVALNLYCDAHDTSFRFSQDGSTVPRVTDNLYDWLKSDLESTDRQHIFVIGHTPMFPHEDIDWGGYETSYRSHLVPIAERDRFWQLLVQYDVLAYICGHYHAYLIDQEQRVWHIQMAQIGHDIWNEGKPADPVRRSTFTMINVDGNDVTYDTYRTPTPQDNRLYNLFENGILAGGS
jgi:hypothetical protein